jgi:hypothetical protein
MLRMSSTSSRKIFRISLVVELGLYTKAGYPPASDIFKIPKTTRWLV